MCQRPICAKLQAFVVVLGSVWEGNLHQVSRTEARASEARAEAKLPQQEHTLGVRVPVEVHGNHRLDELALLIHCCRDRTASVQNPEVSKA